MMSDKANSILSKMDIKGGSPSDLEIYLFYLHGFLVLEGALSVAEVSALNRDIDALLPLKPGEWRGYVHGHNFGDNDGLN